MPLASKRGSTAGPDSPFWAGKRILLVSPEAWGPIRLSKHHYASTLMAMGADVYFLAPDSAGAKAIEVTQAGADEPFIVTRPAPMRGLRYLPRRVRAWVEAGQMKLLAAACGGAIDILWNFDLYRFRSLTHRAHARTRIVHAMDLRKPADLMEPASHADQVLVVSPKMVEALGRDRNRAFVLPHAWMPRTTNNTAPELAPGIKVGYLGNLAMRAIDWGSILEINLRHPQVNSYLMGPLHGVFGNDQRIDPTMEQRLRATPNIHLTGPIPYNEVPTWLQGMDVLLLAYEPQREGLNPTSSHKLMEYMASGKVVVSSYLEDHQDLLELMVMARPGEGIAPYFSQVINQLERYNTPELQARRKAHSAGNSYEARVATIAELMRTK